MASLQEQLLKAGLIDNKKVKQAKKEKAKENNVARRASEPVVDERKQQLELERAEKIERDRELNRKLVLEKEQKAIAAQIKQLIENHRQSKDAGQNAVDYNFTHGKLIKKIRVSPLVHEQITRGLLAVVKLGDGYELVPRIVADKIAQRDEQALVVLNTKAVVVEAEDDPYKDYVIPDDLMW